MVYVGYNVGARALPDIYICTRPWASCVYMRQGTLACVITYTYTTLQWRSQLQPDARAHIFSKQLVVQVITIITPVYIAKFIVSYVHSLLFVVLKKCTARLN